MSRHPREGIEELRSRVRAAEETLRAIRTGEVDALVVAHAGDDHVVTLQGADVPYRMLLDQMSAGAVTLTPPGVIVYCNQRFADIVRTPLARVIGSALHRFVPAAGQATLAALLEPASRDRTEGELVFRAGDGTWVPVSVSFAPLRLAAGAEVSGVIGVVVDATERKQQEELRSRLIEQVMTAQDAERGRIARELHDETGQSLTALLVGLRTIEDARTTVEAVELAQRLREVAARTLRDVGRLARGLHPSVLDDLGLAVAVTRCVQEFARVHGIAEETRIEGLDAPPPSPLMQTTVYRVLQEALTNVAKHAGAHRVRVRLTRDATAVELRVQDDGAGFEPGAVGRRGLGLRSMEERAALLGGVVQIASARGKGTTITARLPLRPS
ncbi:MAG TPA: ATP-binding protein [Gemmatimonadales bacterium]|nr:ATP-binding protein [Gemmatimonadales bacterium]